MAKKDNGTPVRYQRATSPNAVHRSKDFGKWRDRMCSVCFQRATKTDKRGRPYCKDHCPD